MQADFCFDAIVRVYTPDARRDNRVGCYVAFWISQGLVLPQLKSFSFIKKDSVQWGPEAGFGMCLGNRVLVIWTGASFPALPCQFCFPDVEKAGPPLVPFVWGLDEAS